MKRQGERLKKLRLDRNMTLAKLAELLDVSTPTVQRYESGEIANMKAPTIKKLSEIFGVSPVYIMGLDIDNPSIRMVDKARRVPILGTICAGDGIWCEENYEGHFVLDPDIKGVDFVLKVNGESMAGDNIHNGDIAYMKSTNYVDNGKIAAILLDNNEVMLKRLNIKSGHAVLTPSNPDFEPIVTTDFMVLGELVGVYHEV